MAPPAPLGEDEHVSLLTETLEEDKETDEKLTQLAEQANTAGSSDAEDTTEAKGAGTDSGTRKDKKAARRIA
jgi:hypothetical protein